MAFTPGAANGVTTGTSDQEMVAAPAASTQRMVRYLSVYNADTVAATVTVKYADTGGGGVERVLRKATLAVDETLEFDGAIVLEDTDSIDVVLEAAVTTNELEWTASWADIS